MNTLEQGKVWHSLEAKEVLDLLNVEEKNGLSSGEVESRQKKYGFNVLTQKKGTSLITLFLLQFHQPLVYILLAATVITALLGEWVDSSVIFGVLIINAVIGFIQEEKAIRAIDSLAKMSKINATVIRDGKKVVIDSKELVVGDIVILSSGDKVPADMRILKLNEIQIDESSLTGESVSIQKESDILTADTLLADRKNMLYSSTLVTFGRAVSVVVAIGDKTEIGNINQLMANTDILQTPLTKKISSFSKILLYVILGMAALTFLIGILRGEAILDMFMASVALAVGAIPEGLPAAMTIILAIGVSRMVEKNAIIRKLPAVETLGSTTVICSDKTGTLTQNEMTVKEIYTYGELYDVSGIGYLPEGSMTQNNNEVELNNALRECLIAGAMCNSSMLVNEEGHYKVHGDPTEGALLVSAHKAGITKEVLEEEFTHLHTLAFESQHQYMASHYKTSKNYFSPIYIKGSIDKILPRCDSYLDNNSERKDINIKLISDVAHEMALKGMRVLLLARKHQHSDGDALGHHHLDEGLTFLGLQAMIDPPRNQVIESIQSCHKAGISVKMITGDHSVTALAIADNIGIKTEGDIKSINGRDIENLSDDELADIAIQVNVFARVAPEQKLRLVRALQSIGNVVAMTGDGVNDAPALHQANIGTAMGIMGTEVAKESADMILTDDDFSTIRDAVEEGRGVFDNIVKFITWTIPTNIGEGLVIMFAVIIGTSLPILPVQILWINMTTAVLLGLMLAFEVKETGLMDRVPRLPDAPILSRPLIFKVVLVGFLLLIGAFGAFWYLQVSGSSETVARTVAVNIFVFGEMFYLFTCRSMTQSMFKIGVFSNKWLIYGVVAMTLLQIAFTYVPFMNLIFKSAPLAWSDWLIVLVSSTVIYLSVEFEKRHNSTLDK
ncbi:MAG: cation-transporting P-type ATPase [Gammaproteobacteria bacterium]|nr:cation-transporting P-type ATPase [Gammaproteobacteria bacterium]